MRLRNVLAATLAFTYIFYTLSYQASTPVRTTRKPKAVAPSRTPTKVALRAPATPQRIKKPAPVAKILQSEEEDVPWDELRDELMDNVQERLTAVAPTKAKQIMKNYLKERESFTQKMESLMKERDSYYYYDKEAEKIVFTDKLKYKELNKEVTASYEEYNSKVEKIFADHYPVVMEVREEFEEYMQLYNRNEHRIGIGL